MLNLRYWFLRKPSGPATIIAPTAFAPWMCELSYTSMRRGGFPSAKVSPKRGEQLLLRLRLGELAAERLARIGQRVIDQLLLLAALRQRDLDLVARSSR